MHELAEVILAPVIEALVECLLKVLAAAVLAQEFVFPAEVQPAGQILDFADQLLGAFFHLFINNNNKNIWF